MKTTKQLVIGLWLMIACTFSHAQTDLETRGLKGKIKSIVQVEKMYVKQKA